MLKDLVKRASIPYGTITYQYKGGKERNQGILTLGANISICGGGIECKQTIMSTIGANLLRWHGYVSRMG